MVYFAVALVVLVALLVLALYRQQISAAIAANMAEREWRDERAVILAEAALERRSLMDRIQHPAYHQPTEPIVYDPPTPPKDLAELGFVGREVPDFYRVGTPPEEMNGDAAA
jgi:hypothetical protein